MTRFDWRAFVLVLALLSTTAFAANLMSSQGTDEDVFFYNNVLIDGVDLPEDLSDTTLRSEVDFGGTGSLTVGYQTGGGYPSVTVFGGTTIISERKWDNDDDKLPWEGFFLSPVPGQTPNSENIVFDKPGNHENSTVYPVDTFIMGLQNEKFMFSQDARFVFPVNLPDGKRVWYAYRETKAPDETAEWEIEENDFCVIKDGVCVTDLSEFNAVVLVQEFFSKCPRSRSSDTRIQNGYISGPPSCEIECNPGYILNDSGNGCDVLEQASTEGQEPSGDADLDVEQAEERSYTIYPGYFRFTNARGQLDRYLDPEMAEGAKRDQIERQNAALLKTTKADTMVVEQPQKSNDDSFLNYLLQVRNFFGAGSAANVFSAESDSQIEESGEIMDTENQAQEAGAMHSSAPLLPSTGPGIFVGLAALGLGLMIFGAKGRR